MGAAAEKHSSSQLAEAIESEHIYAWDLKNVLMLLKHYRFDLR